MMKRILFITCIVAAALLCSCKKDGKAGSPSVTWAANTNFSPMEMAPGADGAVALNAPGLFENITITLSLGDLNLTANPYIGVSANKGSGKNDPVFDLIDDSSVASFLQGLGMSAGQGLRGKSLASLDLLAILEKLIEGQPLSNNTTFTLTINIMDQNAKSVSKAAKFYFTSEPSFTLNGNAKFDPIDLGAGTAACKVKISAPGKLAKLTVKLENGADSGLESYITKRTKAGTLIDLVNNEDAIKAFQDYLPGGAAVTGKSDVTLDFGFMFKEAIYDMTAGSSTNIFSIYAEDQNGKSATAQIKFTK